MSSTRAIILAAGKGTRMNSDLPKVLHTVQGISMIEHVIHAVKGAGINEIIIVVGHKADLVRSYLGSEFTYVLQEEQLGTGHAVLMSKPILHNKDGNTLIICGDTPLITSKTIRNLLMKHENSNGVCTILTTETEIPTGYGRIVRNELGYVTKIVEEKDATEKEKLITEINSGITIFQNTELMKSLEKINNHNKQGEYYLTSCIEVLVTQNKAVIPYKSLNFTELIGINDTETLKQAESILSK